MTKIVVFFFGIFFYLFGCNTPVERSSVRLKNTNPSLFLKNGIQLYHGLPFTGILTGVNPLGETTVVVPYLSGRKEGEVLKTYANGAPAAQRFYKKGHKVGTHTAWWKNGRLKFKYQFNNTGAYHGAVKSWYSNGQPYQSFRYSNGKEIGAQKMWEENGKIRANYVVKNGDRFGLIGLKKCNSVNTKNEK